MARRDDRRPNILWLCTDQQRYDTLGCTGNRFVRTPHLDHLARDGVLCTAAFAQNPLCQPSRGSFLTGRYPSTNRLRQNGQPGPGNLPLITRDLAHAGYQCGLIGKLHLSNCDQRQALGPEWWRFPDRFWHVDAEQRQDDGYGFFAWDHAPGGKNAGSAYLAWLRERGVDLVESRPRDDSQLVMAGMSAEHHQTTFCAEQAIGFIQRQQRSPHPWLLSVNIFDPHPAFNPPAAYLQRYLDRLDEIPLPNFDPAELNAKPAHQRRRHEKTWSPDGIPDHEWRLVRAAYWAMVDLIDEQIGRILEALDATGQREETLIIFMSDHGELLGDHGSLPKGPMLYDCALQVPLIISWPQRFPPGRIAEGLIELTDLAPTLADAAALPRPRTQQGRSLWEALCGRAPLDPLRDDVYAEYHNANPDQPPLYLSMVRTATHKLVAVHNTGEGELYDLTADPDERHNRWDDPACTAIKVELLQRLSARQAYTVDPLPARVGVF